MPDERRLSGRRPARAGATTIAALRAFFAMKPFVRDQLQRYADRLSELDFLLSRPDIMADMDQFLALSREHAEVAAVADRYARWRQRRFIQHAGKVVARVRLKSERATDHAALRRFVVQQRQHGLMATVYAVKITNREGAARSHAGVVQATKNLHNLLSF